MNHSHIERGLTICEETLVSVPYTEAGVYRLQFIVVAHESAWSATAIATAGRGPVLMEEKSDAS